MEDFTPSIVYIKATINLLSKTMDHNQSMMTATATFFPTQNNKNCLIIGSIEKRESEKCSCEKVLPGRHNFNKEREIKENSLCLKKYIYICMVKKIISFIQLL